VNGANFHRVMRDLALERGDEAAVVECERAAELCERAPEEWELVRATQTITLVTWGKWQPGEWIQIADERFDGPAPLFGSRYIQSVDPANRTITLSALPAPSAVEITSHTYADWSEPRPRSRVPPHVAANRRRLDGRRR
jgi:hypothetical protein